MLSIRDDNAIARNINKRTSVCAESIRPVDLSDLITGTKKNAIVHAKIKNAFDSIPVLSYMDEEARDKMILAFMKREVIFDEKIIEEGEEGDYFYIIEKGHFQIEIKKDNLLSDIDNEEKIKVVNILKDSGYFGELALLYNKPRNATVRCISETGGILWSIDRMTFKTIIVSQDYNQRKVKIDFLRSISLFSEFSDRQIDSLSDALNPIIFEKVGQKIIREGEEADALYIIESGDVYFEKETDDKQIIKCGQASKGDYFGEMALINHAPRAATVRTLNSPVKLLKLNIQDFDRLMGLCHAKLQKKIQSYS